MERQIRVRTIDGTGDTTNFYPPDKVNQMIKERGPYLAYDAATNEQIHKVTDDTKEVVFSRGIVAG